jgi:hypothetical protein
MKTTLLSIILVLVLVSCSKKDNNDPIPEKEVELTNELVGTTWQRKLSPSLAYYLRFKTGKIVEFSSNNNGYIRTPIDHIYSFNERKVIYTSEGYNYTGTISGDTMTIVGTAGYLIYVKMK